MRLNTWARGVVVVALLPIILSKSTLDGVACMSEDRVPGDWTEEFVSAMFGNGQRLTDSLVTLVSSVATSYVCVSYGNYCIPVIR